MQLVTLVQVWLFEFFQAHGAETMADKLIEGSLVVSRLSVVNWLQPVSQALPLTTAPRVVKQGKDFMQPVS